MTSIIQKVAPQLSMFIGGHRSISNNSNTNNNKDHQDLYFFATGTNKNSINREDRHNDGVATPSPPPYEDTLAISKAATKTEQLSSSLNDIEILRHQNTSTTIVSSLQQLDIETKQQDQPQLHPKMIDTTLIGQSMTLIHIATEMQSSKQMSMALGLYMVALDKMMAALPCKSYIYIFYQ